MIDQTLARWHQFVRGENRDALDDLLAEDCVFWSPIVFSPQRGKELTKMYLAAAFTTLGGEHKGKSGGDGSFRYVNEVSADNVAMLEFETSMDGVYVNGVDIITVGDDGRIVEFKVMLRPLKAVNAVHEAMRRMLEQMQSG